MVNKKVKMVIKNVKMVIKKVKTVIKKVKTVIKKVKMVIERVRMVMKKVKIVIKKVKMVIIKVKTVIKMVKTVIKKHRKVEIKSFEVVAVGSWRGQRIMTCHGTGVMHTLTHLCPPFRSTFQTGSPLKPLRDDSALRAISTLRGTINQQMLNAPVGINGLSRRDVVCHQ